MVDDGVTARRKDQSLKKAAGTEKKLSEEPKCDDLIVISSDEKEKGKAEDEQKKLPDNWTSIAPSEEGIVEPCGRQRSREKTLRNRVKAFSSILTARSKVILEVQLSFELILQGFKKILILLIFKSCLV